MKQTEAPRIKMRGTGFTSPMKSIFFPFLTRMHEKLEDKIQR